MIYRPQQVSISIITFLFMSILHAVDNHDMLNNSYTHTAQLYLPSFPKDTKNFGGSATRSSAQVKQSNTRKNKFAIEPLNDHQKRKVVFDLLEQQNPPATHNPIGKHVYGDLEILCGNKTSSNHLFSKLNRTTTVFGEAVLAEWTSQGSISPDHITRRQETTKYLLSNKELSNKLKKSLGKISSFQDLMLSYWIKGNLINQHFFYYLYFGKIFNKFNNNPNALHLSRCMCDTLTISSMVILPAYNLLKHSLIAYQKGIKPLPKAIEKTFIDTANKINLRKHVYELQEEGPPNYGTSVTLGDYLYLLGKKGNEIFPQFGSKGGYIFQAGGIAAVLVYFGMCGFNLKKMFEHEKLKFESFRYLHEHVTAVSQIITQLRSIYLLLQEHPTLVLKIPEFTQLDRLFNATRINTLSQNLNQLLQLLNTPTFKNRYSFFSHTGRILATHKLMYEIKDELIPALEAVGNIDAHLSIAQLMQEHENQPAHYSFVKFEEHDTPSLTLKDFWNPMLNPCTVITNDIHLGHENQNMILTGPNTAGKSTIIKGVILSLILGQSLGIAPASHASFTMFENINTYLNITDNLSAETSLFKAELLRAKELAQTVRSLHHTNKFSFIIIDELFTGPSPYEGEKAACQFIKRLTSYPNSMFIVATHYPKLTDLGHEMTGIVNYKVTAIKEPDGSYRLPYKLEPGINDVNMALDLIETEKLFD